MPFNTHSPLLKKLPEPAPSHRTKKRFTLRLSIIAIISAVIGFSWFVIYYRALPEKGAGFPFYWIHDHIFLPLKGYTYSLFYPYSISWWGMITTLIILWIIGFLAFVSFFKEPHIFILRKMVRRINKHSILLNSCKLLNKWKFHPVLVKEITSLERKRTSNSLLDTAISKNDYSKDILPLERLTKLTHLQTTLMLLPPYNLHENLEALVTWHQTFLQIGIRLRKKPDSTELNSLTQWMAKDLEEIISPLFPFKNKESADVIQKIQPSFTNDSIMLDLLLLASLNNKPLIGLLMDFPEEPNIPFPKVKHIITSHLVYSTGKRLEILDKLRHYLEINENIESFLPSENDDKQVIAFLHSLALSIAVDTAALAEQPSLGRAYIEMIETLDFLINNNMNIDKETVENLKPLIQFPTPLLYSIINQLSSEEISAYRSSWKQNEWGEDSIVLAHDFDLAKMIK